MALQDFGEIAPTIQLAGESELLIGDWPEQARDVLTKTGALLLRGPVLRPDGAEQALARLDDDLLDDAFWSTPRSKVGGKTLTATEYPSPRTIALHTEMAYMPVWPRFIAFHSIEVAETGGETTVCSVDAVSATLGEKLKSFRDKGVTYRRTFQKRFDITWQHAFQTDRREDVENIGLRFGMAVEWLPDDVLVTTHTAQGTIDDEQGRPLHFNQAHLFHPSSLEPLARQALEKVVGKDRLPRMSFYGDGSPIPDADLQAVRDSFLHHQTGMRWRSGDILILDNLRYAHGRLPFVGSRKLHVALARATSTPVRTPIFEADAIRVPSGV